MVFSPYYSKLSQKIRKNQILNEQTPPMHRPEVRRSDVVHGRIGRRPILEDGSCGHVDLRKAYQTFLPMKKFSTASIQCSAKPVPGSTFDENLEEKREKNRFPAVFNAEMRSRAPDV